jgi:hypothetical protein
VGTYLGDIMKLDLTKAHTLDPYIDCFADGEKVRFAECVRCRCFFPIIAGSMMCMYGIGDMKKELTEAYTRLQAAREVD